MSKLQISITTACSTASFFKWWEAGAVVAASGLQATRVAMWFENRTDEQDGDDSDYCDAMLELLGERWSICHLYVTASNQRVQVMYAKRSVTAAGGVWYALDNDVYVFAVGGSQRSCLEPRVLCRWYSRFPVFCLGDERLGLTLLSQFCRSYPVESRFVIDIPPKQLVRACINNDMGVMSFFRPAAAHGDKRVACVYLPASVSLNLNRSLVDVVDAIPEWIVRS